MVILSYGMLKSGSTLAFELCKALLQSKGFEQRPLPADVVAENHQINFIRQLTTGVIDRLRNAVRSNERIVVKIHSAIRAPELALLNQAILEGDMALQVSFRDPREIGLSLMDAGERARKKNGVAFQNIESLADATKIASQQLRNCLKWGAITNALHLNYNDVAFEPDAVVSRMLVHYELGDLGPGQGAVVLKSVFQEAFTQRNKAVRDRYKDELTVRQNEFLLSNISHAQAFIRNVLDKKDYDWFYKRARGAIE